MLPSGWSKLTKILYFLNYWGHKYYKIVVNFDHPDGSTSWGYICYYILVEFDSPDGSTN